MSLDIRVHLRYIAVKENSLRSENLRRSHVHSECSLNRNIAVKENSVHSECPLNQQRTPVPSDPPAASRASHLLTRLETPLYALQLPAALLIVGTALCPLRSFWLVESAVPGAAVEAAQRVYAELCIVPLMARFAAFSRRVADDQVCLSRVTPTPAGPGPLKPTPLLTRRILNYSVICSVTCYITSTTTSC